MWALHTVSVKTWTVLVMNKANAKTGSKHFCPTIMKGLFKYLQKEREVARDGLVFTLPLPASAFVKGESFHRKESQNSKINQTQDVNVHSSATFYTMRMGVQNTSCGASH